MGQARCVGVLDLGADGYPMGKAADGDTKWAEQARKVKGGGVAFHVWVRRQHDLRDRVVSQPLQKRPNAQRVWANSVQRTDRAVQYVVQALKFPRALKGEHVLGVLHHTNHLEVSSARPADLAWVGCGEIAADAALVNVIFEHGEGARQISGGALLGLE